LVSSPEAKLISFGLSESSQSTLEPTQHNTMSKNSAEFSYPIGALGKRKCDEVAEKTGVTFAKFNRDDRHNGFQRISFTGPNLDSVTTAIELLDGAVTKFNRHKAWEKKNRIAGGLHATQKRSTETTPRKGRFSNLPVDETSGPKEVLDVAGKATSDWKHIDVSKMMPGLIESRKKSIWEEKASQRKNYSAPVTAPVTEVEPTKDEVSYREMVAQHEHQNTENPELPEPPLWAQQAWHEADMGRPMLEPSTGPLPIDEEYRAVFQAWEEAFADQNSAPTEDELLDEASEMFEEYRHELRQPPVTEQEIIDEWDEWELEHDVALNVIDEAIANREFQLLNFVTLPPDHILGPNGELCILERGVTDPAYLSACPC